MDARPLRRRYDHGEGHRAWLLVLRLIAEGSTRHHAARVAGVPHSVVYARLARLSPRNPGGPPR